MQRLKCDMSWKMQLIAKRLIIKRTYKTGSKNFYEVLGLHRLSTQVRYF